MRLYDKIKAYADDREIPVLGAIRMILSDFFRNKAATMDINELPEGVIDMGEGKGLVIDMARLRDDKGVVHIPPSNLSKEQTLEWISKHQAPKKDK